MTPQAPDADALTALFYEVPTLSDGRVTLRPATGEHAERLGGLMCDVETLLLTGTVASTERAERIVRGEERPWGSAQDLAEVYERWSVAEDRAAWVIQSGPDVVGELHLMDLDVHNRSSGLRLWIAGATDRGIGTAALSLALDWAFRTAALHRVSLEVYEHNPRARHVYEKLGFVLEGTQREVLWLDGRWVGAHTMGLLRHEWLRGEDDGGRAGDG